MKLDYHVPILGATITSYFTEQEKKKIAEAAAAQGFTMSAFVAEAALADANRINVPRPRNQHK
jgi:uncharacterized protein (DUF1778 family)